MLVAFSLCGCGDSDNFVFTNSSLSSSSITTVPQAADDNFSALGNATLNQSVANGVLVNDTLNGAVITEFDPVASNGGAVDLNDDGSFTYTPAPGFVGSETFNYTISNAVGSSTATVRVTTTGRGLFVNNSVPDGGTGSQVDPFNQLDDAIALAVDGDVIFVARGNGSSTGLNGAKTLPNGVDLIGEGSGLILSQTVVPQGDAPLLTGPITCLGSNTVSGLAFEGATDDSIVISGTSDVAVKNNTFSNLSNEHIDIDNATGTITIDGNTFGPVDDDFIGVDNLDSDATFVVIGNTFNDDNTIDPDAGIEFDLEGSTIATVTISGNTFNSGTDFDNNFVGLEIDSDDSGQVAFTITDNTFTNCSEGINIDGDDQNTTQSGTISGNTMTNIEREGMALNLNGRVTISGNVLTDCGIAFDDDAIDADNETGATMTLIIVNNRIAGSGEDAVSVFASDNENLNLGLRNNTLLDSGENALSVLIVDSANACLDVTGNTVDSDLFFDNESTGDLQVERAVDGAGTGLLSENTFTGATVVVDSGTISPVDSGACQIP